MNKVSEDVINDLNFNPSDSLSADLSTELDTSVLDDNSLIEPSVVFYTEKPNKSEVLEAHQPLELEVELPAEDGFELSDNQATEPENVIFTVEIPGVDQLDPEKEKELETELEVEDKEEEDKEKQVAISKWEWQKSHGVDRVLDWAKDMYKQVPKHTGYDVDGVERAVFYIKRLLDELSKAMRSDLDGVLDAKQVAEVRKEIEKGFDALNDRLNKITKKKSKKSYYTTENNIVKQGQKSIGIKGVYITVPLLISRIARVCINGMVSAGRDIEDLFHRQVKKYKLNEREQAETMQLLADMGYPIRSDRGFLIDDEENKPGGANGYDFAVNYQS